MTTPRKPSIDPIEVKDSLYNRLPLYFLSENSTSWLNPTNAKTFFRTIKNNPFPVSYILSLDGKQRINRNDSATTDLKSFNDDGTVRLQKYAFIIPIPEKATDPLQIIFGGGSHLYFALSAAQIAEIKELIGHLNTTQPADFAKAMQIFADYCNENAKNIRVLAAGELHVTDTGIVINNISGGFCPDFSQSDTEDLRIQLLDFLKKATKKEHAAENLASDQLEQYLEPCKALVEGLSRAEITTQLSSQFFLAALEETCLHILDEPTTCIHLVGSKTTSSPGMSEAVPKSPSAQYFLNSPGSSSFASALSPTSSVSSPSAMSIDLEEEDRKEEAVPKSTTTKLRKLMKRNVRTLAKAPSKEVSVEQQAADSKAETPLTYSHPATMFVRASHSQLNLLTAATEPRKAKRDSAGAQPNLSSSTTS